MCSGFSQCLVMTNEKFYLILCSYHYNFYYSKYFTKTSLGGLFISQNGDGVKPYVVNFVLNNLQIIPHNWIKYYILRLSLQH